MAVNQIKFGNTTLIDLSNDTVTAADLASGKTAHDRTGTQITGTASGGCTVKSTTAKTSSNATSISFTSLSAQPKMFCVQCEQQQTLGSTRYVISVICDGTNTYGTWGYRSGSSAYQYYSSSYFTWTYSGGTLTVSTNSSSNGGYFHSGYNYRLIYAY